jgi:hypothetical protein
MDQAILVTPDVLSGTEVLKTLDSAKINPAVLLLMASSDDQDWRLVISSPALDQTHLLKAYEQVTEALQGRFIDTMPPILVLPTKDPFIRDLRRIFSTKIRVGPQTVTRLGGQTIGNRFILDAYVYRVR